MDAMIYTKISEELKDVNDDVLKQVSIYLMNSTDKNTEYNVESKKFKYGINIYDYVLVLSDGRRIYFSGKKDCFNFLVLRYDLDNEVVMSSVVSKNNGNINIYGTVKDINNGVYILTFRPKNMDNDSLKYGAINYYTVDELDWIYSLTNISDVYNDLDIVAKKNFVYPFADTSYFEVFSDYDFELDSFDGYVNNVLVRIDLLYNNVRNVKKNKLIKTR